MYEIKIVYDGTSKIIGYQLWLGGSLVTKEIFTTKLSAQNYIAELENLINNENNEKPITRKP